jgi:hypothetical protein
VHNDSNRAGNLIKREAQNEFNLATIVIAIIVDFFLTIEHFS